jgi:ATP-binding cassette subfamily C protein
MFNPRQKIKYFLLLLFQFLGSLLDLIAIASVGALTLYSSSQFSSDNHQGFLRKIVEALEVYFFDSSDLLVFLAIASTLLFLLKSLYSLYFSKKVLKFLSEQSVAISYELFKDFSKQSLTFVQKRSSQEVVICLNGGVNSAIMVILGSASILISEAGLLIILAVGLIFVDPILTIFAFLYFFFLTLTLQRGLSVIGIRSGRERTSSDIEASLMIQESISSFREISVADRFPYTISKFLNVRKGGSDALATSQWVGLIPKFVMEGALIFGAAMLGVYQFLKNDQVSAVASLTVFLAAGSRILPSILRIQGSLGSLQNSMGSAEYTFNLMKDLKVQDSSEVEFSSSSNLEPVSTEKFTGKITMKSVSFTYPQNRIPSLKNINLDIPAGSWLAIVGSTGAGKSTLTDMILGLIQAEHGEVKIGGIHPKEMIKLWPGKIAYVPQDVSLFNASLRENVAIKRDAAEVEDFKVWDVLEKSQLADYVRSNPEGLNAQIGERGMKLSGGQKQRLGLARALYTDPEVLILDEATSSLDAETEDAISRAINSLPGQVTLVTIAHRLSTVRNADQVVFLDKGEVIAIGSFDEVRKSVPSFDKQANLMGL